MKLLVFFLSKQEDGYVLISNRNRNMNYFIAFTKCDAATTTKELCFYSLEKGREMLLE